MTARPPDVIRGEIREIEAFQRVTVRVLIGVAIGALVFTMVSVTEFAGRNGISWWIAWMLDPILQITLVTLLIGENLLTRYNIKGGLWVALVKWGSGLAVLVINVWQPWRDENLASFVLHAVMPLLLVGLAEAVPRIRLKLSGILAMLHAELAAHDTPARARRESAVRTDRRAQPLPEPPAHPELEPLARAPAAQPTRAAGAQPAHDAAQPPAQDSAHNPAQGALADIDPDTLRTCARVRSEKGPVGYRAYQAAVPGLPRAQAERIARHFKTESP